MAREQQTEKATPKRRREAREEGRVARSSEIGSWLSLLGLVAVLPALGVRATHQVTGLLNTITSSTTNLDPGRALGLFGDGMKTLLGAVLPIVAVASAFALAANLGQVGFHISPGALGFRWSRVNPKTGFTRIVSPGGVWDLAKGLARLAVLGAVGYLSFRTMLNELMGSGTLPIGTTLGLTSSTLFTLGREIGIVALCVALADFAFQRRRFEKSIKMTKVEVKAEQRETDGSPEIRREQRRRRRRLTRLQILAAVNHADVVVVNPTHLAVAIKYDKTGDRAPRLTGKAEEDMALLLRQQAIAHGVPVVENPPIARAIHAACEVGEEIPPALYEVVARLLAFVYRLSPTARMLVDVHRPVLI